MSDEQLKRKAAIKKLLIGAVALLVLALGIFYFRFKTDPRVQAYQSQKSQEAGVQSQVDSLMSLNAQLMATIEENGKELVSFTDDKIKYINLASELSLTHSVRINKLTVSDVWQEGEMSGMTTTIEVEGQLPDVRAFVEEYCGTNYTNRINTVSCRPSGRYVWLSRGIDSEKVLEWFDLSKDQAMYDEQTAEAEAESKRQNMEFGMPVAGESETNLNNPGYTYDPESGQFTDSATGLPVDLEELEVTPITLDKMFANAPYKVYLVIDFLGRA